MCKIAHKTVSSSINDSIKKPSPIPLIIVNDIADRLAPLDIRESALWFVTLVADQISYTGKHVDDLTVRELRKIINDCRTATNAAAKRKKYWWKYT